MSKTVEKCAYVTLLTDDTYIRGVLVLAASLRRVKAKYKLICYHTGLFQDTIKILDSHGIEHHEIEQLSFSDKVYEHNKSVNKELANLWKTQPTKFNFFNLTDYDTLVYLDADTMVLNNCDELFNTTLPCRGVIDGDYNDRVANTPFVNAGVLVIKPNKKHYSELISLLEAPDLLETTTTYLGNNFAGIVTEQDILNGYFKFTEDPNMLLSKYYNIFASYTTESQVEDVLTNGKIIHYTGHKYWQRDPSKNRLSSLVYPNKTLYEYAYTMLVYLISKNIDIDWDNKNVLLELQQIQNKTAIESYDDPKPRQLFCTDMTISKKLCVYAICKNEMKFVDKWLDNMSEADYIVVLDTGSTDGTYEKLKADPRVTRVEQQVISPWRFDVARNESMKLIPEDADILVCTDFDELFTEGWATKIKEVWRPDLGVNRVHYKFAWSHTVLGEPTDIFMYDKVHTREFNWKFPVHEVLWPVDISKTKTVYAEADSSLILHHYPDKTKSRTFYFDLLKLTCEENPTDCHPRMLLAREYLLNKDYDNALKTYLEVLKMPDVDAPEKRLILLESLGRCADCYKILNNYDEALWYCQEFIKEDYTYREPYLIMSGIYNEMNMPTLALACAQAALNHSTRKNNWLERANSWISEPEDLLAIAYYKLKQYDNAIKYNNIALKHYPDDPRLLKNHTAYLQAKLTEVQTKSKN